MKVAKIILRYLEGSQDLVLFYPKGNCFDFVGYVNDDYAGFFIDKINTLEMAYFLGSSPIHGKQRSKT